MPTLSEPGDVRYLNLGDTENRFGPAWLDEMTKALDALEQDEQPCVLVTHGEGRFYSNGLDLEWAMAHGEQLAEYVREVQVLLARVLLLGVPTVAAVNGHAFGAGAMLALAHDFRVMRTGRGYFCFPEVDINIPFTPGMAALIQAKVTPAAAVASMTTGHRFDAPTALAHALVDEIAEPDALLAAAAARVRDLAGKNRATLTAIKNTMFGPAAEALTAQL
jgi:Delta3-Delta2-enoyl-CoA isomerase